MEYSAVILAGGQGLRFGEQKQFYNFKGKEIWRWSFDTIKKHFDDFCVVGVDVAGGLTRQESVKIGINKVTGKYVVIFDGARPLVNQQQIKQIKDAVKQYKSVTFGMLPTDTIYDGKEYRRAGLTALQVPQAFDRALLVKAHNHTQFNDATDDTIIFKEYTGIDPKIIPGGLNLYKLTVRDDLKILNAL